MTKEQLAHVLRALDTFDHAAQECGWHSDRGGRTTAFKAKRLYRAAKARLVNLLKDAAEPVTEPTIPLVSGLDNLLTDEERSALQTEYEEAPQLAPPAAAVAQLHRMGYSVAEWHNFDGWWVGYSHHDNPAICTIAEVTGKALIEVCKQHDFVEILLP